MEPLGKSCARLIVLVSLINSVVNFNFDTNFTIVYENPGDAGDLFGYSVILYEGDKNVGPWVQIGTPKAKTGKDNMETGNVYRCGIKKQCYTLSMPIDVKQPGAALGNSMDISPDGRLFATCGHRWIEPTPSDYYSKGFCHWGRTNENTTQQKIPFEGKQLTTMRGTKKIYEFGQGQAGFAIQFVNIREVSDVIVGAPGVYNWAGLPFLWKGDDTSGPSAARRIKRASESLYGLLIASGEDTPANDLSFLGYSVTSGRFFDSKHLYYVAGAPRVDMIGQVYVFEFGKNGVPMRKQELAGRQYGEYYGGSLASANLNGDDFSDLIVGAPTYKGSTYNEGKVYIYYGSYSELRDSSGEVVEISGRQAGGQFGESVASLGDIDFDGFDDIAVAATYEDEGIGAVYIYRGSQDGILTTPSQVIKGKSFATNVPNIQGFGHSIARPRDIDGNRYNDLAIGAYKSGQVFIFRARPVIILYHEFQNEKILIRAEDTGFNFTSCIHYTTNQELDSSKIVLMSEFTIDQGYGRAYLTNKNPDKIELSRPGVKDCRTYSVKLKETITNRNEVIKYTLNLRLEEDLVASSLIRVKRESVTGNDNFCPNCPVVDPKQPKEWEGRLASFHLGCKNDSVCISNVHVTTLFKGIDNGVFVIGSEQFVKLVTEVTNAGERAYLTELSITLPSTPKISLRSVPPACREENITLIICTVADPLDENGKKTIELELDMDKVNSGSNTPLTFNVSLSTSSVNNGINSTVLNILAEKQASIKVTGRSKEKYYQFDNTSSVVEFAQVLQIQKDGYSTIDNVEIDLLLPTAIKGSTFLEMYQPTLAPKGQLVSCSGIDFIEKSKPSGSVENDHVDTDVDKSRRKRSAEDVTEKFQHFTGFYVNCTNKVSDDLDCVRLYCYTGMVSKDVVEIQFKFRLNIANIPRDVLGESDVLVVGNAFKATIKDRALSPTASSSVSEIMLPTVLVGPNVQKMIPIWIIIVAVLCGILVLAIIAAVLYKFGFFRRTQKEKLMEEMKADNEATEAINLEETEDEEEK